MSTTDHYKSNRRDIEFNLFEFLDIGSTTLGRGPFGGLDVETTREVLAAIEELSRTELGSSFAEADRVGLEFDPKTHVVKLPAALRRSLDAYYDAGWDRLSLPERLGGSGAPPSVAWATFELLAGAHGSLVFYLLGSFMARAIDRLGTESQKRRYVNSMIERRWGASMVLTEPEAGSDVGAARTKARHVAGDVWELEGTKRFITNGEYDGTENIVHVVLARPEGAGPGTKGLSMFIVPKIWVEEDGSLGEPNGVVCSSIEKKMGLKASTTCEMVFGETKPARGLLVGEVHDGIRQMFHVIEHARMAVGAKSMATLSTAYLNALSYAKERVQGPDLAQAANKAAPRVPIIRHPDMRRMLMLQKAYAEGMRALCLYTAHMQDQVEILGGHGAAEADEHDRLNDLLLPLVKGFCSEKVYELLAVSLQCYGGSGYVLDHPIEQYIRDQKIDSLYEGTTHIQALDLFFRKIIRDGGATFTGLLGKVRATIDSAEGGPRLAREREALAKALGELEGIAGAMLGKVGESPYHVGLHGNRILFSLAQLVIGWLLVRQGAVANARLEGASSADRPFYAGKLAAVRFYCDNVLPELGLARRLIEKGDLGLMELPDEAF